MACLLALGLAPAASAQAPDMRTLASAAVNQQSKKEEEALRKQLLDAWNKATTKENAAAKKAAPKASSTGKAAPATTTTTTPAATAAPATTPAPAAPAATAKAPAPAQPAAPAAGEGVVVFSMDFNAGLPKDWQRGAAVTAGLPPDSKGAVGQHPSEERSINSSKAWVDGYFTVQDGMYFNFRAKMNKAEWYQVFLSFKDKGPEPKNMRMYEYKPPVTASSTGWQVVSVPISEMVQSLGEKGSPAGQVCWNFFWSFDGNRDLGFVVDRVWVTKGPPGAVPPPKP